MRNVTRYIFITTKIYVQKSYILAFLTIVITRDRIARSFATFATNESRITNYHRPLSVMWRDVKPRSKSQLSHHILHEISVTMLSSLPHLLLHQKVHIKTYNVKIEKKELQE